MLNKFDRPNADFTLCVDSIRDKLHVSPLVLYYPVIDEQGDLTHIGDVLRYYILGHAESKFSQFN